jgi:hypothetical protein
MDTYEMVAEKLEKIAPSASDNTDYVVALRALEVYNDDKSDIPWSIEDFREFCEERLHAEGRHDA